MRGKLRSAARWAVLGAVCLVAVLCLSALGVFVLAQDEGPAARGSLSVPGLAAPLKLTRDPFGVPHVHAANRLDAFAGLGFAHAQDRLWQMEMLRRAARGTLSELFGSVTVEEDRLARTLGLHLAASAEVERLSPGTIELLEHYATGVNAWIDAAQRHDVRLPFEFRWLALEPEPWTVADTLAIVRLRSWMLGRSLSSTLLLEDLWRQIGAAGLQPFFPVRPVDGSAELVSDLMDLGGIADRFASRLGMLGPVGSLGFVIGAKRSVSGKPMLANDPHLEFRLPPLFYMAHLGAPGLELAGATWPGVPVFWTGTNRSAAWGQVILHASTSDVFTETFDPDDPLRYDRNGRWIQAEKRTERVDVRFGASHEFDVITTRHGPLLSAVRPDDASVQSWALRWTGQSKRSGIEELLGVQAATGWDAFREALRHYPSPAATFLFAHESGVIGTQLAGDLPVRKLETGLLSVTGNKRTYDWRGFMPFDELPFEVGDDLGWLVASTHPKADRFVQPVYWLWHVGGASARLESLISDRKRLSIEDVVAIQTSRQSKRGPHIVKRLLEGTEHVSGGAARVREILLDWDGDTTIDSPGPSVYHVFRQLLAKRVLDDRLDGKIDVDRVIGASEPVPGALKQRFLDRVALDQDVAVVREVLEETWRWLGVNVSGNPRRWSWGELHRVRLDHDFERLGWGPERWLGRRLGRGPFPVPGDPDSVWTMHHASLPTTRVGVGPVLRYAVDLADPDHARFALAGGQSGHPGSARYDDGVQDWIRGRSRPLWMHSGNLEYFAEGTWDLLPGEDTPYP